MNLMDQERYKIYRKLILSLIFVSALMIVVNFFTKEYSDMIVFVGCTIFLCVKFMININVKYKYYLMFFIGYQIIIFDMVQSNPERANITTNVFMGFLPVFFMGVLLGRRYLLLFALIHSICLYIWFLLKDGRVEMFISFTGIILILCVVFYNILKTFEDIFDKMSDITENLELEIDKKTMDLQQMNTNLTNFIHSVSHEIRTPLTAIIPAMSMIRHNNVEIVDNINRNLYRVVSLINEVLEIAKYDSSKMTFTMKKHDINDVVKECIEAISLLYQDKNLYLDFTPYEHIEPFKFDKKRICQCLLNILNNSLKFTVEGGVSIKIDFDQSSKKVRIVIRDTGIGIPESYIDYIFEEFKQVPVEITWDDSLTNEENIARIPQKGSGLGLSIAKRFIEGHHGEIWIESEGLGSGTTCIIELPTGEFDETG